MAITGWFKLWQIMTRYKRTWFDIDMKDQSLKVHLCGRSGKEPLLWCCRWQVEVLVSYLCLTDIWLIFEWCLVSIWLIYDSYFVSVWIYFLVIQRTQGGKPNCWWQVQTWWERISACTGYNHHHLMVIPARTWFIPENNVEWYFAEQRTKRSPRWSCRPWQGCVKSGNKCWDADTDDIRWCGLLQWRRVMAQWPSPTWEGAHDHYLHNLDNNDHI